jgi:UDP-glucose 4-epimerase
VIGLFQKQFSEGHPMTIIGDGLQSRDFTHVSDVVEANMKAFATKNKLAIGQVFNIGTGINYTIIQLAWMIGGKDASIISMPERLGEVRHSKADISKAKRILEWEPNINLEEWINEFASSISNI